MNCCPVRAKGRKAVPAAPASGSARRANFRVLENFFLVISTSNDQKIILACIVQKSLSRPRQKRLPACQGCVKRKQKRILLYYKDQKIRTKVPERKVTSLLDVT
jgi:hypothetical protein